METKKKAFWLASVGYAGLWGLWIALLFRYAHVLPWITDLMIGAVILLMPQGWWADRKDTAVSYLVRTMALLTLLWLALLGTARALV
jgi:hypothetical protein